LIIGGAMAAAIALPPYLRRRDAGFEFQPLQGHPGFRRLDRGAVTARVDPFAGLDGPSPAAPDIPLCQALFGAEGWSGPALPVAVFSDVNCPNCAAYEARLLRLQAEGTPIRLTWHQLPLLGPRSVWAAKVILAARRQDAEEAVHRDLMSRVLRPGPAGVRDVAERHGLDATKLLSDAQSGSIQAEIDRNLGLGASLSIPGTPGSVIGRTLVIGAIPTRDLERLIALEQDEPPLIC
jgi:predicted DsbA family dithiol-disulfide isomerase